MTKQNGSKGEGMSQETRQRIVEGAVRVLARDGYAATSVKDIASEAGVAPGLVHYYFKTKEELVAAAVALACQPAPWPEADSPAEAALLAMQEIKRPTEEQRLFQTLFVELLGHATRHEPVRRTLRETVAQERAKIEEAARAVIAAREDWSPDHASAIAAVVWAAGFGINVQRLLDPEFDRDAAVDALTMLALR
jgi:AcrR family transcriptional regulator